MRATIDRIENGIAAVELDTGEFVEVSVSMLPPEVHDGTVLIVTGDIRSNTAVFKIDAEEESSRRTHARSLLERLKSKNIK